MLRSIVTYISYLHINSGIERNGGRSHVGTAAPAVQASAARPGFRLSIIALNGGVGRRLARPTRAAVPPYVAVRTGSRKPLEVRGQKWAVTMRGNGHENLGHGQRAIKRVGEG